MRGEITNPLFCTQVVAAAPGSNAASPAVVAALRGGGRTTGGAAPNVTIEGSHLANALAAASGSGATQLKVAMTSGGSGHLVNQITYGQPISVAVRSPQLQQQQKLQVVQQQQQHAGQQQGQQQQEQQQNKGGGGAEPQK